MSVINTNILALSSQNNLQKSQSALGSAIERLSSGMRINSAKDDAAGQAIANRFTANVRGLTQAARNANDGISIAQTTEGSLDEINNNLQRIRELTVQAANGSNSASDLKSIQNEISERLGEINRISEQTDFNGVKVLGQGAKGLTIQVGAHDNETITINLKEINVETLGLESFSVNEAGTIENQVSASDFSAEVGGSDTPANNFAIEGSAYNGPVFEHGGQYYVVVDDVVHEATIEAQEDNGDVTAVITVSAEVEDATVEGTGGDEVLNLPDGVYPADAGLLGQLDDALQRVDDLRSHLGAIQNRFESTITNLNNTVNNLSAARSRIEDADYAVEVSNMTRAQILQQAGTSVLAQANQVPQTVLSLLR